MQQHEDGDGAQSADRLFQSSFRKASVLNVGRRWILIETRLCFTARPDEAAYVGMLGACKAGVAVFRALGGLRRVQGLRVKGKGEGFRLGGPGA